MSCWYVYIVETECGKLYTGIATDVQRRFEEHQTMFLSKKGRGAKFFLGHKPKDIVRREEYNNRSEATKREAVIKKMSSAQKRKLIFGEKVG